MIGWEGWPIRFCGNSDSLLVMILPVKTSFSTQWDQINWQLMTSNLVFMQNRQLVKICRNHYNITYQ